MFRSRWSHGNTPIDMPARRSGSVGVAPVVTGARSLPSLSVSSAMTVAPSGGTSLASLKAEAASLVSRIAALGRAPVHQMNAFRAVGEGASIVQRWQEYVKRLRAAAA